MTPHQRHETSICYHYSLAGRDRLSRKWAEIAYQKNPSASNAFNLALDVTNSDEAMYQRLMEESLQRNPDAHYTLLTYGQFLKKKNNDRGQNMIEKAYQIMLDAFDSENLSEADYGRLISAARLMDDQATVRRVEQTQRDRSQQPTDYSQSNLLEKVGALTDQSTTNS